MINKCVRTKNKRVYLILDKVMKNSFVYYLAIDVENKKISGIDPDNIVEIGYLFDNEFIAFEINEIFS